MRFVGYGLTSYPTGQTTQRREKIMPLDNIGALTLEYSQDDGGPCSGDSGGAVLTTDGNEKVAGVIANVAQGCVEYGTSGRVREVYDSFIAPYLTGGSFIPGKTCPQCKQSAVNGAGACSTEVEACRVSPDCQAYQQCIQPCATLGCIESCDMSQPSGSALYNNIFTCVCDSACASECTMDLACNQTTGSSSSSGSSGAGGSSGTGVGGGSGAGVGGSTGAGVVGWNAGNQSDLDYDGEVLTSGCSVAIGAGRQAGSWLAWLGALLLTAWPRRRRWLG
jgi:hypothetical protein